jgi:hypothetical protein
MRLAVEVADSLPDPECVKLLEKRARDYYLTIDSPFFQSMCNLARDFVLRCWRVASQTGRLPRMADNVVLDEDQVPEWLAQLSQWTGEPGVSPQDQVPFSSRLGRPVEGSQTLTATSVLPDLRKFTVPLLGRSIGQDLVSFICRLERIATFFEGEASVGEELAVVRSRQQFRRLITYFFSILSWADSSHLRGSYLISSCQMVLNGPDAFHLSNLYKQWLTPDLKNAGRVMLVAAESLGRRAEEEGPRTEPSPPPGVDANTIAGGQSEVVEAPEGQVPQAPVPEQPTDGAPELAGSLSVGTPRELEGAPKRKKNKLWADPDSAPPEGFVETPLEGEQWQIAWALLLAGLLRVGTLRGLEGGLKRKKFWGKKSGNDHSLYIKRSDLDRAKRALEELEKIKARGPYHPRWYDQLDGYKKHQASPLESSEKKTLAEVLHQVGLLKEATVNCLDETIERGGKLFGKYDEGIFTVYLPADCPEAKVEAALKLLRSK